MYTNIGRPPTAARAAVRTIDRQIYRSQEIGGWRKFKTVRYGFPWRRPMFSCLLPDYYELKIAETKKQRN